MAERTWTDQQKEVINHRGGDLTVSAAAGSGKTTVMVERVLRLIREEKTEISRMLIVTFTRAAAGEMRQRIAAALDLALQDDPKDTFLRRQRQALQDAPIGTLHGFCGDLLRSYGAALGLDPDFTLCDETRRAIFWNAAKEEALNRAFSARTPGFTLLARGWSLYTNDGLERLCDAVQSAYSASPLGVAWVREAAQAYEKGAEDPFHSPWMEVLRDEARSAFSDAVEKLDRALRLMNGYGAPEGYRPNLEKESAQAKALLEEEDGESLLALLEAAAFAAMPRRKKDDDPALAEAIKRLRDEAKEDVQKTAKVWQRIFTQRDVLEDTARMVPAMYALADLMEDCEGEFARRKEARNCLDFNDLEHKTLALLADESVREEISQRFLCVFCDEYQDTNAVQEAILMKIARPGTFFCVGDAKQAIYRFRQADPTLFLDRYERSSEDPDAPMRRIDLFSNFRSHPGILRFVNAVFSRTMTKELGGLVYDKSAALDPGLDHPEPEKCVVFADLLTKPAAAEDPDDEELQEASALEREAYRAAWRIRQRMGLPIRDGKKGYRPARFRDFVILMERAAGQAERVAEILRSCGIPCVAQNDGGWAEQPETLLLLSALRYLDNSDRAQELMTLLHSPFGGFSLEDLLTIRRSLPDLEFPQAVRKLAEGDDALALRLAAFLSEWDELRRRAATMDVESLIWEIAGKRAWYLILGARPGGQEAQRRVRRLAEQARSLSETRERSLYAFLRFMDSMSGRDSSEASATGVGEEDAVWITTIHKSKGLEFPVVLLMCTGRKFRGEAVGGDSLLFHDKLGLGPMAILEESHWKSKTLAYEAVMAANKRENRSERLRLLYVALTRAQEELYILGTLPAKPEADFAQWTREETAWDHAQARCLLDWIAPILVRHPAFAQKIGAEPQEMDFPLEVTFDPPVEVPRWTPPETAGESAADTEPYLAGFAYRYPYEASVALPGKVSVTSLLSGYSTRRSDEPGEVWPQTDAAHDPRRAGTLTHAALQYLRYGMDAETIRETLAELAERGVFSQEDLSLIRVPWLARFCAGEIARRAEASPKVLREKAFNLFLPAGEVYPEKAESPDFLMLQGVIDLAFLEEEQWVLIDYKTNHVPEAGPQALLEHYRPQLTLYRRALEMITTRPVKAAGLVLLSTGETVWMED